MTAVNNEWVNDLAKNFNATQKDYKIVPVYKGAYDESMTAAVAAYRAGNAPAILQVFEVGTATMMASKGVVMPVGQIMKDAGYKFDPSVYVPAVAGYYTAPNGQMLSFPFNSSTTVFYFNKDAFKLNESRVKTSTSSPVKSCDPPPLDSDSAILPRPGSSDNPAFTRI